MSWESSYDTWKTTEPVEYEDRPAEDEGPDDAELEERFEDIPLGEDEERA